MGMHLQTKAPLSCSSCRNRGPRRVWAPCNAFRSSVTSFHLLLGLATGLLVACAGFEPRPIEDTGLLQRAETQTKGALTVTISVPSADETRELFDSDLYDEGIQPVWIEIRNGGDQALWFHPHGVDADYFPPLEVARRSHRTLAGKTNRDIDAFFYNRSIPLLVPAHGNLSGFVFVNLSQGIKYVPVKLYREGALPGLGGDRLLTGGIF